MNANIPTRFLDRTTPPHLITLVLMAGLSALSMNVFLPSLPSMSAYFNTEYGVMQLSVSGYLAASAVLQLFIGQISDRFGRRPVLLVGFLIFLLATVGCLVAPTVEVFLIFRMIQAVIATGMVLSRAIVRDMVPSNEAASMIGYVTMGMAIVPMVGPAIGGVLDTYFGWQANFEALIILGLLVGLLVWADVGETNTQKSSSFMAQLGDYPELFRSRRFWGYSLVAAFASGTFFAFLGGAPFVATIIYGLDSATLGILFGITSFGYIVGNFISGRYSTRIGINRMMLLGTAVTTVGLIVLAAILPIFGSPYLFFSFMFFVGLGNGMVLPNANAGMLSVRPQLAGTASGLGGAIMIGGGAALSALDSVLLTEGSGVYPLLLLMLTTSILSILTTLYIMHIARIAGPLTR